MKQLIYRLFVRHEPVDPNAKVGIYIYDIPLKLVLLNIKRTYYFATRCCILPLSEFGLHGKKSDGTWGVTKKTLMEVTTHERSKFQGPLLLAIDRLSVSIFCLRAGIK